MQRIALYARVSTVDRGQDPEVQLRELRAWAARLGVEVVAEYVDQLGILDAGRVQKLLDQGLSVRTVARQTGYSRATITRRFSLAHKPAPSTPQNGADFTGNGTRRTPGSGPTACRPLLRITDATTPGRAVILVPSGGSENGAAR
jgi:hypothetical protein